MFVSSSNLYAALKSTIEETMTDPKLEAAGQTLNQALAEACSQGTNGSVLVFSGNSITWNEPTTLWFVTGNTDAPAETKNQRPPCGAKGHSALFGPCHKPIGHTDDHEALPLDGGRTPYVWFSGPDHSATHRPNKYLGDCCENCGRHPSLPEFRTMPCEAAPGHWRLSRDRYVRKLNDVKVDSKPKPTPEPYEGLRTGFGGLACGFIRRGL